MPEEPVRLAYPKFGYLKVGVEIKVLVPCQNFTYAGVMVKEH
jgi:hypothetical protein